MESRSGQRWTNEEEQQLRDFVLSSPTDQDVRWEVIAKTLGRTQNACRSRWTSHTRWIKSNSNADVQPQTKAPVPADESDNSECDEPQPQ